MAGPPPPLVLEELADAALAGLDLCNHQLRVLFECLHRHDIEPFCQEEIIRFRRCSQQRYRQNLGHLNRQDKELRERLLGAEQAYSVKLSSENRRQRREELEALISLLDRRLILATGVEGMAGFKQRWQLNGQLHDARSRLQVLKDVDKAPIATTATAAPYTGEKPRRQHCVSEGYLRYSQFRAVQHTASAALNVLSVQSLLFAAGLRPSPAQATIVSWVSRRRPWFAVSSELQHHVAGQLSEAGAGAAAAAAQVLKDGMQHVGKLACSSMGTRMDAEPKRWRIFADVMFDVGAGLEVLSPLAPQHFLAVAGAANMAKGMGLVSARSTRLPIYASFAREGNLSDLYAKGEAISTLSNILGIAIGIRLASTVCSTHARKLAVAPLLSAVHLWCVTQEMKAAPVNTLNEQRTALVIQSFLETGVVPRPQELRYRERVILPVGVNHRAGGVHIAGAAAAVVRRPSDLAAAARRFAGERFLLAFRDGGADMLLHQAATGEDAVRGWLLAACAAEAAEAAGVSGTHSHGSGGALQVAALPEAYQRMEALAPPLLAGLQAAGWHTHLFLEGSGVRGVW
eukprot:SM000137S00472  [mRNA]  locus=s137:311893:315848:+ [translate_table: standard]